MLDGLGIGRAAQRKMARLEPVFDGRVNEAGLREVVRHDFRLARHDVGKRLLEGPRDLAVQLLPAALEEGFVGRIPYQRVLEAVNRFRRLAAAKNEPGLLKLSKRMVQRTLVASHQLAHEAIRELAPDGGADLTDLLHRREAIEARH